MKKLVLNPLIVTVASNQLHLSSPKVEFCGYRYVSSSLRRHRFPQYSLTARKHLQYVYIPELIFYFTRALA